MDHASVSLPRPARPSNTVLWVIAVLLAFIAGTLWNGRGGDPVLSAALAQNAPAGARGIYAFTGQIDERSYGVFMLDVDAGTLWCYEIDSEDGVRKLRLVAARAWMYDRLLRDFNVLPPNYLTVRDLVARERAAEAGRQNTDSDPRATDGANPEE
jgi:hypothetical protein